ncbi:hypothetical protein BHM03_00018233 [Ensete ventricosum]|nr:hypothetical protein BHM03_00018233 [Ensete ventricosum]
MRASARSADDARTRATVAATALRSEAMRRSEWGGSGEEGGILKKRARRRSNNSEMVRWEWLVEKGRNIKG